MKGFKKFILVFVLATILIFTASFIYYGIYNWAVIPVIENYFNYILPNIGFGFFIFFIMLISMLNSGKDKEKYDLEDPELYVKIVSKFFTYVLNFGIIMLISIIIV